MNILISFTTASWVQKDANSVLWIADTLV